MEEMKARYEIWLGNHYSHFGRGVAHMADGRDLPLKSWIQPATYGADCVMIDDEENYAFSRFPLRWFTCPGSLEFYCWDEEVTSLLIHNDSEEAILIDGIGTLQPGESKELMRDE